uniref:hypothetical protein n=1 Tax=Segatella hominis TaxID=2518605 RepID=UPI0040271894
MKELKVGERVTVTLEVVEQKDCQGCFFNGVYGCHGPIFLESECAAECRSDGKDIIYKEVKE